MSEADLAAFRSRLAGVERIHLDAPVLARHLLGARPSLALTRPLFRELQEGETRAQTSAVSLYQILAEPYRHDAEQAALRAAKYLSTLPGLELIPVDHELARQAAEVRARLGTGTASSLQIATALSTGAGIYLTEGSSLRRIAGTAVVNLEVFLTPTGAPEP